jgi:hypothetical protein
MRIIFHLLLCALCHAFYQTFRPIIRTIICKKLRNCFAIYYALSHALYCTFYCKVYYTLHYALHYAPHYTTHFTNSKQLQQYSDYNQRWSSQSSLKIPALKAWKTKYKPRKDPLFLSVLCLPNAPKMICPKFSHHLEHAIWYTLCNALKLCSVPRILMRIIFPPFVMRTLPFVLPLQ